MPGARDIIADYLLTLANPSSNSQLQKLQDLRQEDFDSQWTPETELPLFEEPLSFEGSLKNGWCRAFYPEKRTLEGFFHEGSLVGNVLESVGDEGMTLYYCKRGVRHGFTRSLRRRDDGSYLLENLGTYINGVYEGFRWKGVEGGGYYLIQEGCLKAAFIYPDFSTAMLGTLDDSHTQGPILSSPIIARVTGISWIGGILVPTFQPSGQEPLREDPFERLHVVVSNSSIPNAGEGLFSVKKVKEHGVILAYFHGEKTRVPSNSEYSIRLDEDTILDIPNQWLQDGYKSTLGHKVCHSFEPNAEYSYAFHPLYGRIRCICSLKSIEEGEEITCNYKYSLKKRPPPWYIQSLQSYMDKLLLSESDRLAFKKMLEG